MMNERDRLTARAGLEEARAALEDGKRRHRIHPANYSRDACPWCADLGGCTWHTNTDDEEERL